MPQHCKCWGAGDFEMIYFEIKSLFFSLMKRTKNQGFGIVVKAQISIFHEDSRSERFILFAPEMLSAQLDLLTEDVNGIRGKYNRD